MRKQLMAVDGVKSVSIDYDKKTATVDYAPGTDPMAIAKGLSGRYAGTIHK